MELEFTPPVRQVSFLDFPDFEKAAANLPQNPIIANAIDTTTTEGAKFLNDILFTRYQGDVMSATPKCSCGGLSGSYNRGLVCEACNTVCEDVLNKPLESTVWVETPKGINKFIGPGFWTVASKALTRSGFNLLHWLVDPQVPDPGPKNQFSHMPAYLGINSKQRNLNFFYANFEQIMRAVVTGLIIRKKPKGLNISPAVLKEIFNNMHDDNQIGIEVLLTTPLGEKYEVEKEIARFMDKYLKQPNRVFTNILPLPSAQGMILEQNKSGAGLYAETHLLPAINAMHAVVQLDRGLLPSKPYMRNRHSVICTMKMAEYGKNYIKDTAGSKEGAFRRHINGGRIPFSMRCVITSINAPHRHDEVWLPWSPSVQFYMLDIINKLTNERGFNLKQARRYIDDHTNVYSPLLDEIFQQLIRESSEGRDRGTFQRSPSLLKGSIQLMYAAKVKTDPQDLTISMSINNTNLFNADFDGDCMHWMRVLDNAFAKRLHNLKPHRNILDTNSPRKISGAIKQQPPQTLTIQSYLYGGDSIYNPQ